MTVADWRRRLEAPPDPPELPEAADPPPGWPPWFAPVALVSAFGGIAVALLPILPLAFVTADGSDAGLAPAFLLLAIVVQDAVLVGTAVLFAALELRPRPWHFGLRETRLRSTAGWVALAFLGVVGFELGYLELFGVDEGNADDLGGHGGPLAAVALALAVIVVAPVTEEFFFRGFFYRALRTRLGVPWAAAIDGAVFAALHFESFSSLPVLPVIAVFGVVACLLYERTGSLFAVIAVHALFNTVATAGSGDGELAALLTGAAMGAACVLVPRRLGRGLSPLRGAARRASARPARA